MATRLIAFVCAVGLLFVSPRLNAQLQFEDVASSKGLDITIDLLSEGGGVSFCDFNGDGWDDLTFTSATDSSVLFFQNNEGIFTQVTFDIVDPNYNTKHPIWVDYDNDGDKDFFVTSNLGLNKLYQNQGDMTFIDVTGVSGLDSNSPLSTGCAWGDYDKDGFLDVMICKYDFTNEIYNQLYHNEGDGTFTNVTETSGIGDLDPVLCLNAIFCDFNNDGWQDIYINNDRTFYDNYFMKNNGDGTFSDISAGSGGDVGMDAMSATVEDFDNDGWMDIYITNTSSPVSDPVGNALLSNNGDETFTNVAGATGTTFNSFGWGALFLDADLDTHNDLYVSGFYTATQPSYLPSAFYHNNGNDTCTIPEGIGFETDSQNSYGNALGDFNNDGKPDMVVINDNALPFLWENQTTTSNGYLKVKLEGVTSNKDGIGSKIEILADGKVQYRYVALGESYLSQNSNTEFFGLGNASNIDYVQITWSSGTIDIYNDVTPNQTLEVVEGSTLGLDDRVLGKVSIYPNPSTGTIMISGVEAESDLMVYNILGQNVYERELQSGSNTIDFTSIPKGIYYFKISNESGVVTKKIELK
ncbi:FG-GAP-like repeat-containing protein [Mangrovimonas sp. TPBH4]|uniref:FG-GAP-like repeat-containing protein n=1 Tax=Mangrovimonas sp. TPBH4 TaxID=1645914 RepID=UPI0009E92FA9|nr:FG-GAP-like repeat-containing protein [Mangrovimonas sp. TPBH4]